MRWWRMACVALLIVLGAGLLPGVTPRAAAIGAWTAAGTPPSPGRPGARGDLTALADGRALLTHYGERLGDRPAILIASRYDPAANTWTATATADPMAGFAAPVRLNDGTILLSGGGDQYPAASGAFGTASAQRYDPTADRWTPTGALARPRARHTATLLPDGSVLVAGGQVAGVGGPSRGIAEAERYDPQTGKWSATGSLAEARSNHAAVALRDGRVLVVGGQTNLDATTPPQDALSAELYDPATGRWTRAAEPLRTHGGDPTATLLRDGRILLVGGVAARGAGTIGGVTVELYDPAADTWTLAAPLRYQRSTHTAAPLPDGRVLIVGGASFTEIYDPAIDRWASEAGPPIGANIATALRDGRVLSVYYDKAALYNAMPGGERACFAETGQCLAGPFLAYWRANGGLARNGYPISAEQVELLEDGKTYTVQYFERVRMEYHPENGDPQYQVLLGQFGRRILSAAYGDYVSYAGYQQATKPVAPTPGARFFAETGHNISPLFLAYWEANGGLAQFGYPITEERWDSLPNPAGACCKTQYFERARFEYHPENEGTPYVVLLGQFGRQLLADNARLGPTFGSLYLADTEVRERLGAPRGAELRVPGALQPFERGLMVWRGDERRIFVLAGAQESGSLIVGRDGFSTIIAWPDTWEEGQDPGGGAGPRPGLHLPQRGFGKLWREQGFRNDLGYATTPNETGYPLILQEFAAGYLLTVDGPNGRAIYAIYLYAYGSHGFKTVGEYERVVER